MDRILCFFIYIIAAFARFSKPLSKLGLGSYEEWRRGKRLKILLVGYNGARNTGADARVVAIVDQLFRLYRREEIEVTVMTLNRKTLQGYFPEDVNLLEFSSLFPLDLYRACSSHHAAILCEGSALKSTFANALSLFFCEAAGIMAAQKKPCIAYGAEVGSMDGFLRKAAAGLCRKTYFITRTQESQTVLESLRLKGHVGTDTAWTYDQAISRTAAEALLKQAGWDGRKPLLGIAVMNPFCWPVRASLFRWIGSFFTRDHSGQYDKWYFFSDSPGRRSAFLCYARGIAAAVRRFRETSDAFPVLIGMERLDRKACLVLKELLDCPCAVFTSGDHAANVMTGILLRLSALITSRYHAAVLSMENGCPIAAVSIDERLDSLMKELSFERDYLCRADDPDLENSLYSALSKACTDPEEIRTHIHACRADYQAKLEKMGSFLKRYFARFSDRRNHS